MDLRLFHSGEILEGKDVYSEYSLGYMFLENLVYNTWTPWDLRSYMALVAAKIMRKDRLYPTTFTSKLSLLVKGFVKANLQLIFQYDAKELQSLALKLPAESVDLEISSTALTSQAHNDAGVTEGALMQRSLSAMINLGVVNLTSRLTRIGEQPEFFGGSAEIWKAGLTFSNAKMTVAVKYLRLCVTQVTKHLYREIRIWQSLEHPHVLPLLGICHNNTYESVRASGDHAVDPMMSIGIVCPWMANGTLVDFLKLSQTKMENTEELCLRLLIQVCSGLIYLHSKNIVHGDLHGGNVLVDSDGCARLADFGLSAVVSECRGTSKTGAGGISSPHGGALRWAAPELVVVQEGAEPHLHPSADIYSVGGLVLQTYTGAVPYSYYNEPRVLGAIIAGEKPRRPTIEEASVSDVLWSVIEECWRGNPLQRPTAAALASRLKAIYSALEDEQA
ncbi:kinase-like domain-containing protein [Desarmillaria tabescens]|uniref:Kinase-like domain-containing protein n=1 Tax=Armillaria tabescens TaxID=1929756 RepID=A0AA39MV99_ARMTA|nr:kinase-like domain-containing protein [Desarmillaria tabescens]KAK0447468.1 kinase-like domain-containing protein [Desarmillaria tabescens]